MTSSTTPKITELLVAWSEGDVEALEKLTPLIYEELHKLARHYMSRERREHSLQTTGLVNEAYLRLIDSEHVGWQNRTHFFAASAQVMRHILVDFARKNQTVKHGGAVLQVSLDEALEVSAERAAEMVALDDALKTLAALDARQARVVELRYFGGLSVEETAEVLKISTGTVKRDWRMARAWLQRELSNR